MSFLSNIFGGGDNPIQFQPKGFAAPGGSFNPTSGTFTPSTAATANLGGLQSTFGQGANAFGGLAQTVQPGFSQLRRAGLNQLNTQQQAATSNLRDTLAQRRVLGSSFANASLSQQAAEFGQQKADFAAQSYLQELQASQQLIQQQYQFATQQFASGINQMNFESGLAAQFTSSNNQINASIAEANAKLQADAQGGIGKLFGTLLSAPGSSVFGQAFTALGSTLGSIGGSIGSALGGSAAADSLGGTLALAAL